MNNQKLGRRVKLSNPFNVLFPFFMNSRVGSTNYFKTKVIIDETERYIKAKREEGLTAFGIMSVIAAAYVRTVASYPRINRFVRGQRIYARNSIDICLTVKETLTPDGFETIVKYTTPVNGTATEIHNCGLKALEQNKASNHNNDIDRICNTLNYFPNLIIRFLVWILKCLDYFRILPNKLVQASPFHASMFFSNVGSLGIPAIYHHLYDFGCVPLFISFGKKEVEYVLDENGNVNKRKYVEMALSCDERVCDGYYYARAVRNLKRLIENPWSLDTPPEKVEIDR